MLTADKEAEEEEGGGGRGERGAGGEDPESLTPLLLTFKRAAAVD